MRLAFSQNGKEFLASSIIPTPKDFDEGMAEIKKFSRGKEIKTVVGGIASVLDRKKNKLINPLNIESWKGRALKKVLQDMFKADVFIENDADLAGLGEALYGAGRGKRIVAYLTISTGVGGVRIVDKKIDANAMGFEPGHHILFAGGNICSCGGKGDLEAYISGSALEKRYGKKPQKITDKKIWDEEAIILAYALNNVTVFWSPDIIILGGSLMEKISLEQVRACTKKALKIFPSPPAIKRAEFGDLAGLHGALALLQAQGI